MFFVSLILLPTERVGGFLSRVNLGLQLQTCHTRTRTRGLESSARESNSVLKEEDDREKVMRESSETERRNSHTSGSVTRESGPHGHYGNDKGMRVRLFSVELPLSRDGGKDSYDVTDDLREAAQSKLGYKVSKYPLQKEQIQIIRKSFDGRLRGRGRRSSKNEPKEPKFVYTLDISLSKKQCKDLRIKFADGRIEKLPPHPSSHCIENDRNPNPNMKNNVIKSKVNNQSSSHVPLPRAIIVGAGPAGLFAAVVLARAGFCPLIIERGQPVEKRGKDIGALFNRRILNSDSNLCYGEGGAGTWSDGKLTTRIGKNSDDVRFVLQTLVEHGAPEKILVDGKPHLGTDKLVVILRNLRAHLISLGAEFRFDTKVIDLLIEDNNKTVEEEMYQMKMARKNVKGVVLEDGEHLSAEVVVLAVGHSSRPFYETLMKRGFQIKPKEIAVGFRIEHPQELINHIQYGSFAEKVESGKGIIPVADYRLTAEVLIDNQNVIDKVDSDTLSHISSDEREKAVYSFCMCPGGQIVPTSVNGKELCVNGMSFSR